MLELFLKMSGILVVSFLGVCGTFALTSVEAGDREELRDVFEGYVTGWREGDVEKLAEVLAAEGSVMWISEREGREVLSSMTFADILKRRKAQPEYGLEWEILALDVIEGRLAVGKLSISRAGGSYTDILVCQKIEGRWKIVNKTFVTY